MNCQLLKIGADIQSIPPVTHHLRDRIKSQFPRPQIRRAKKRDRDKRSRFET